MKRYQKVSIHIIHEVYLQKRQQILLVNSKNLVTNIFEVSETEITPASLHDLLL